MQEPNNKPHADLMSLMLTCPSIRQTLTMICVMANAKYVGGREVSKLFYLDFISI